MMNVKKYYFTLIQKCIEAYLNNCKNNGTILMFHQVNNKTSEWLFENVSITEKSFVLLLEELTKKDVNFKALDEISQTGSSKDYYITFDDGFVDLYNIAYPILKEKDIKFCVFITSSYIGKEGYLTEEMIIELSKDSLCTIGSHTITHPMLRFEKDERIKEEIQSSKSILEMIIGNEVKYFAYPYGSVYACGRRERLIVSESYAKAFSALNSTLNRSSMQRGYFIPRINVNENNYKNRWK